MMENFTICYALNRSRLHFNIICLSLMGQRGREGKERGREREVKGEERKAGREGTSQIFYLD